MLFRSTAPRLEKLWLSPRLAAMVAREARDGDPPVISTGYTEPSLVFLLGTHTTLLNGKPAGELASKRGGLVLVEDDQKQRFEDSLRAHGGNAQRLDETDGVNYSRGRKAHVTLYRVTPASR